MLPPFNDLICRRRKSHDEESVVSTSFDRNVLTGAFRRREEQCKLLDCTRYVILLMYVFLLI